MLDYSINVNAYMYLFTASLGEETITLSETGLSDRQSKEDLQHTRFRAQLPLHWVKHTHKHVGFS